MLKRIIGSSLRGKHSKYQAGLLQWEEKKQQLLPFHAISFTEYSNLWHSSTLSHTFVIIDLRFLDYLITETEPYQSGKSQELGWLKLVLLEQFVSVTKGILLEGVGGYHFHLPILLPSAWCLA